MDLFVRDSILLGLILVLIFVALVAIAAGHEAELEPNSNPPSCKLKVKSSTVGLIVFMFIIAMIMGGILFFLYPSNLQKK